MKDYTNNLVLLFSFMMVLLFTACNEDDTAEVVPSFPTHLVNFSDLQVGQKTIYRRYESTCTDLNGDFTWTGDTLIAEVIETDNVLQLKEYFTPNSPMYINGMTEPIIHPITSDGAIVEIPDRALSQLFFFYGSDSIHLAPQQQVDLAQNSCRLNQGNEAFIGNDIGQLNSFKIGTEVDYTDKIAVSCVPGFWNVDAYLIYDENQLYASHVIATGTFGEQVLGWSLIEEE